MNLNEQIEKVEKEFDEYVSSEDGHTTTQIEPYLLTEKQAKAFLSSKLREIATATLAACEVENLETMIKLILPMAKGYAKEHPVGSNQRIIIQVDAAISEQKKKAEEWINLKT